MSRAKKRDSGSTRLTRHRIKAAASGLQRVEVTVPSGDAHLLKSIAAALRSGGAHGDDVRRSLEPLAATKKAQTGAELLAFLRASPLVGADISFERDRSTGRSVNFEQ